MLWRFLQKFKKMEQTEEKSSMLTEAELKEQVVKAIKTVYDPEIPVNVVDLGLIYACEVTPLGEGKTTVTIGLSQALGAHLAEAFGIEVEFVEVPNPV